MILVSNQNNATFRKATAAMNDPMLPLPGLSPVAGKDVVVKFDGGRLSSDGGILTLREIEGRLRVAERMAGFAFASANSRNARLSAALNSPTSGASPAASPNGCARSAS